jgi:hypothetical protein
MKEWLLSFVAAVALVLFVLYAVRILMWAFL